MATQSLHPGKNRNFHHLRGRYPAELLADLKAFGAEYGLTSPHGVVRAEFQWAIAATPIPELICDMASGTVSGAGGR